MNISDYFCFHNMSRTIAHSYKDNDDCMDEAIKLLQYLGSLSWNLSEPHTERETVLDNEGLRQIWRMRDGRTMTLLSRYRWDNNDYICTVICE